MTLMEKLTGATDLPSIGAALVLCIFVRLFAQGLWRLYFSPISKFPGPKLAALSYWYEFYYDVVQRGQYVFKIRSLHAEYGPIIRINPHELHVSDVSFYDTLYAGSSHGQKRDRDPWHAAGLGLPSSILGTVPHDLHRKRRAALSPFFSMQMTRRLQGLVQERVDKLTERLGEMMDDEVVVPMNLAFSAFSNDTVNEFCFGYSNHRLEVDGFDPEFHHTSFAAGTTNTLMKHMNWILKLTLALPEAIVTNMGPEISSFLVLKNAMYKQITEIKSEASDVRNDKEHPTIFHELLASGLPEREKSTSRLADEAILLIGAGTHTTSWTLAVATYHILAQPAILSALKIELAQARKDDERIIPLATLEKLPYLTAVLKEGLRLSYGTSGRLARVSPDAPLQFNNWVIPAGTPVSMTSVLIHHDETIFPDARAFKPERWLDGSPTKLDRYLVSFSRGSRACLGINLAWAELYQCLAGIFTKFGSMDVKSDGDVGVLELFETGLPDVEIAGDLFFPLVSPESKGVRVKVRRRS